MDSRSQPSNRSLHFRLSRQTGTRSSMIGAEEGDNVERDHPIAMMSFSPPHEPDEAGERTKDRPAEL